MPRILVNASTLHVGGGVAVASSFINGLAQISGAAEQVVILASTEVNRNLAIFGTPIENYYDYHQIDTYGISALWKRLPVRLSDYDVVFSIFGPFYRFTRCCKTVTGLALPYVIYPKNHYCDHLPLFKRLSIRTKVLIQEIFFSCSDMLIVEADHVLDGLKNKRLFKKIPIHVVPSAVDPIYFQKEMWQPVELPDSVARYRLGIIARNYPHKNLSILPEVKKVLSERYKMEVDFFVTFGEKEWSACSRKFRCIIKNAGSLTLSQCPDFNRQMDGVIFPSLLECFSATPIEALASGVPLFASDLPFITDTVKGIGVFFDPLDPLDIGKKIHTYFSKWSDEQRLSLISKGQMFVNEKYSSDRRTTSYWKIIQDLLGS